MKAAIQDRTYLILHSPFSIMVFASQTRKLAFSISMSTNLIHSGRHALEGWRLSRALATSFSPKSWSVFRVGMPVLISQPRIL